MFDAGRRMLIITGPNMGGKSTYMRQTALIAILAHIGSAVPAEAATVGSLDRIFTRIGAADDLTGGRSTFMVEMTETAVILNTATDRSLIILDEIGRGTATYDGLALAWSVVEHIHDRIKAKTLFATHYHELTELAEQLDGVRNLHVSVREAGDQIIFLRKVEPGSADRSYGIEVARLAALPMSVIERAREVLSLHEKTEHEMTEELAPLPARRSNACTVPSCEGGAPHEVARNSLCSDGLDCTTDVCAPTGCTHTPDDARCPLSTYCGPDEATDATGCVGSDQCPPTLTLPLIGSASDDRGVSSLTISYPGASAAAASSRAGAITSA